MIKSLAIVVLIGFGELLLPSVSFADDTNTLRSRVEEAKKTTQPLIDKRVSALNQATEMPTNADNYDWQLAQRTSWWGKPIDSKKFWAGRTIWLDDSAVMEANRAGRSYPPIPYENSKHTNYSITDVKSSGGTVEGPDINYVSNRREDIFWQHFPETHPRPPKDLERKQEQVAKNIFRALRWEKESKSTLELLKKNGIADAINSHYPSEAFEEDTLFWSYVSAMQNEYQGIINSGQANRVRLKNLMKNLTVDPNYVTNSPSQQQIQAMNTWKISYLQRLRKENTDEMYIKAYLKTWKLTEEQVFGSGKQLLPTK